MADKHTPGLWAVNPLRPNQICTADGSLEIASATVQYSVPTAIANARRIVACWNACDGISTENLEENRPVQWLAEQYNEVVKQCDELQASLIASGIRLHEVATACATAEQQRDGLLEDLVAEFGVCGLTEKARAAIAKATGEQA